MKLRISLVGLGLFLAFAFTTFLLVPVDVEHEAESSDAHKAVLCHALPQFSDGTAVNFLGELIPEGRQLGVFIDVALPAVRAHCRHGDRVVPEANWELRRSQGAIGQTCALDPNGTGFLAPGFGCP